MSTALAIAGVTAVLRDLLFDGIIDGDLNALVGDVTVSALAPNRIRTGNDEKSQINLFLYMATPNPGWRNRHLPAFDSDGHRLDNPPLALDLHYMLSAYGAQDLHADVLLGYAMQLLHETPLLTRDAIRSTLGPGAVLSGSSLPANLRALSTAELADQFEEIKISQEMLSTDELTKLWSAFQAPFRTSAAYLATVVLIERRQRMATGLPVMKANLTVLSFLRPVLESVEPQIVTAGGGLTLSGVNMKGRRTFVLLESGEQAPDTLSNERLDFTLPPGIPAGVRTVQVLHKLDFDTPGDPHRYLESNVLVFALAPTITTGGPINAARDSDLTLSISPPIGREQSVSVVISDRSLPQPPRLATDPPTSASLTFHVPADISTGTHLLRVRVDQIESPLGRDVSGQFNSPTITIT